jgi:ELWxxDGT repeat protein
VGTKLYFVTTNTENADGVWRSDGTEAGTILLRSGKSWSLSKAGANLFFFSGNDLWKIDLATETATKIAPAQGRRFSAPGRFAVANDLYYFNARSTDTGIYELWRSDGTNAGTFPLRPSMEYPPRDPASMAEAGEYLYFSANDDVHGTALWRTDGTLSGTTLVKDISPVVDIPNNSGSPGTTDEIGDFLGVGDTLYFRGDDSFSGSELWKSDGTADGTIRVFDPNSSERGSEPWHLSEFDGKLAFRAVGDSVGDEWWTTDGTEAGTQLLADVWPGVRGSMRRDWGNRFRSPTMFRGEFYFAADDGVGGSELWKSDGTAAGTRLVADIRQGAAKSSLPTSLTAVDGRLYFAADDGSVGYEVWAADGTAGGTTRVYRPTYLNAIPQNFTAVDGALYFSHTASNNRDMIWRTDGAADGAIPVTPMEPEMFIHSTRGQWVGYQGKLYFSSDAWSGKLLRTADVPGGVELVVQQSGQPAPLTAHALTVVGSTLYFAADELQTGAEVWISDGTGAMTRPLKDIVPGPGDAVDEWSSVKFVEADGWVYFGFENAAGDSELWRTDGTTEGTVHIRTINGAAGFSSMVAAQPAPRSGTLRATQSELFYFASLPNEGIWLRKSDGTSLGNVSLKKLNSPFQPQGETMLDVNGVMYIVADDGVRGMELWKSDGTPYGTTLVADLAPGSGSSNPQDLTLVGDKLFFTADDGVHGRELWVLDTSPSTLPGDSNDDLMLDGRDIDQLQSAAAAGDTRVKYDLNGDATVNAADVDYLVRTLLGTNYGDANLDGSVDKLDLQIVTANYGETSASWDRGDFDGGGLVGVIDAIVWRNHAASNEAGVDQTGSPSAVVATKAEPNRIARARRASDVETSSQPEPSRIVARPARADRAIARPRLDADRAAASDASRAASVDHVLSRLTAARRRRASVLAGFDG